MLENNKFFFECFICGNKNLKYIFSDHDKYVKATKKEFFIYKCLKCGLLKVFPTITEEEFNIYYPENYNLYNYNKKKNNKTSIVKKIRDFFVDLIHIDKIKNILNQFSKLKIKYLDFGCGNCKHLSHIKIQFPSWKLFGYDKSQFVKENFSNTDFNLISSLENIDEGFFDIINLSSVFEHFTDPVKEINLIKKKLKKKGLVVIKTPNSRSFGRFFFQKNWINYDIPRHTYIFSSKNLKKFLKNNNFNVIKVLYSNNIGVELKSMYRLLNLKKRPKFHNFLSRLFLPFGIFLNFLSLSSTITIIAQKND